MRFPTDPRKAPKPRKEAATPAEADPVQPKPKPKPKLSKPSFASDLKLPAPVADLVADLRERRLLPVALLLIAAIVAVPVLLSSGSSAPSPTPASPVAAEVTAPEGQPVVLKAGQGVRDYKKRLNTTKEKDPFVQQFAAPQSNAASTGSDVTQVNPGGGSAAPSGAGSTSPAPKASSGRVVRYIHYELDAYVGQADSKLKLFHGIQSGDPLPNQEKPVAAFVGTDHGKKAVFMVSSQVTAVGGDGHCVLGAASCSMVTVAPGDTVKFTYGPDGVTYAIKLVRIQLAVTKSP